MFTGGGRLPVRPRIQPRLNHGALSEPFQHPVRLAADAEGGPVRQALKRSCSLKLVYW
jgi:hypothetical protein